MLDYEANKEAIERVKEIDEKRHDKNTSAKDQTKLMFEQMLRGLYLTQIT